MIDETEIKAKKDVRNGALWFIGGIIATLATHGNYLFWGAIIFGAIQFIRGLLNSNNKNQDIGNNYDNFTPKKTVLGLSTNIESPLCYVLGFITGIVFLVIEREDKIVRFHAIQSISTFLPLFIMSTVIGTIPSLGLIVAIIGLLNLVLWLLLIFKAYKGVKFKLPIVGDFAERQLE